MFGWRPRKSTQCNLQVPAEMVSQDGVQMQETSALDRRMAATKEDILDAAERLFKGVGYENASMDAIAIAASVSRKTLFNYVESKSALINMLLRRCFSEPYTQPYKEPVDLTTGTVADLLPPFEHTLKAVWDTRWLLRLGVEHANLFSSDESDPAFQLEPNREARIERARALQKNGSIRSDISAERIVRHFEIIRNAAFREWLRRDKGTLNDLRARISEAMDLMIHGLT